MCFELFSRNDLKSKQQAEKHAKNNSDIQYPAKIKDKNLCTFI